MHKIHWFLKYLRLDDNNEIDVGFGVRSLCIWAASLSFVAGVFYALTNLWELCFLLSTISACSFTLFLYCRSKQRKAYIAAYLFLSLASILVHFFTTYYLGFCGTEFFVVAALLAPHMYHLLDLRLTVLADVILIIVLNIVCAMHLTVEPLYVDSVRIFFRTILSNMGLATFLFLLYLNMSSHDFVDASRQQLIDEASKEVGLDALTGLGNRRLLEQYRAEFEHTVSEESPLSIAIIDIDSFKKVNDTYGHAAGDAVLVFFANKMKTSFRKDDVLIRWGGEEFLIFLRRTGVKDASVLMENLRRGMQETPIDVEGVPIQILITIGLKEHRPLIPLEESIKRSDELMYQGKLQGGNCVVW